MIFVYFENFGYTWGTHVKVPKNTSTQKVFGTSTALFLEYP
jgi:hypothetical protein